MSPLAEFLLIFGVVYLSLCVIIYFIQTLFFFHPEKLPQNFIFKSKYHIPFNEVFIDVKDGSRINALHYTISDPKGVVFYFKGNTRSIKGWGKFSKDFVTKNYDFFMIDYPGFGKSKGRRTESKIYNDAQHAYQWLSERYPEDQIIIYGRSMGGGFATRIASWNKPRMLILDSVYYSFFHLAQRFVPIMPMKWLIRYKVPTYQFIRSVRCPIFFIHGNKDRLIPYKYSVWLHKMVAEKSHLFTIDGGHHNDLPSFAQYHQALYKILNDEDFFLQYATKVNTKITA